MLTIMQFAIKKEHLFIKEYSKAMQLKKNGEQNDDNKKLNLKNILLTF